MKKSLLLADIIDQSDVDLILSVELIENQIRETELHRHAFGQLVGSLEGLLSVQTESGWWVVPATHTVWIPPNTLHGAKSHGPFRGWSVYLDPKRSQLLDSSPKTFQTTPLLKELVHRAASWSDDTSQAVKSRLSEVLFDEIVNLPETLFGLLQPGLPSLKKMTDGLLSNLADNRSLEEWARSIGLSSRTLARRFNEQTGLGFSEWRQRARVLSAIEMLADNVPVTNIAFTLGYENVSAFIAMFRRVMGVTPGQYIQRHNKESIS
ncbi:AraC family transcriptional regulator [Marinomonas sp. UCMA 3892]|nr:helix-turn-helix transcriptional regulator [Marinomonas sp. UCMA 3892]NLV00708.1 AraC family transcriptional regulator [Marinomonas sp. UCMA 3892]